jgi:hypothetical protein
MTQATLKNACMIVLILLAGIALNPTWAGGDHHEAKIKIIGDDFELDETDVSDLEIGESMSFYTDNGREVLILRQEDGFDISVDGESIALPRMSAGGHGGHSGVKVITKEIVCDSDGEECDHEFINIHEGGDFEVLHLAGEELDLNIEVLRELHCDADGECDHDVKVWHEGGDWDIDIDEESLIDISEGDGSKVIIIKRIKHSEGGEEI